MKKILLTLTLLSSTAFADISQFIGQYTLTSKNEVADAECFSNLKISSEAGSVTLTQLYSPSTGNVFDGSPVSTSLLVVALLNGPEREYDGDHDVMSKTKHYDKATLSNGVLKLSERYAERAMGIPLALVWYTNSFAQPDAAGVMKAKRSVQVNLSNKTSQCVYKKVK